MGFVLASKFSHCYPVKHEAGTEPQFKHMHELITPLTKQCKLRLKHILRTECCPGVGWIHTSKFSGSENCNLNSGESTLTGLSTF